MLIPSQSTPIAHSIQYELNTDSPRLYLAKFLLQIARIVSFARCRATNCMNSIPEKQHGPVLRTIKQDRISIMPVRKSTTTAAHSEPAVSTILFLRFVAQKAPDNTIRAFCSFQLCTLRLLAYRLRFSAKRFELRLWMASALGHALANSGDFKLCGIKRWQLKSRHQTLRIICRLSHDARSRKSRRLGMRTT